MDTHYIFYIKTNEASVKIPHMTMDTLDKIINTSMKMGKQLTSIT